MPGEDENDINFLRDEIYRLIVACMNQEKLLQNCDDNEAKLKEDIVCLKIKLVESERVEEGMRKQ